MQGGGGGRKGEGEIGKNRITKTHMWTQTYLIPAVFSSLFQQSMTLHHIHIGENVKPFVFISTHICWRWSSRVLSASPWRGRRRGSRRAAGRALECPRSPGWSRGSSTRSAGWSSCAAPEGGRGASVKKGEWNIFNQCNMQGVGAGIGKNCTS